ncbi:MAG: hypothetical protein ACQEQV_09865, partial [Fibrobacterota bacterium]
MLDFVRRNAIRSTVVAVLSLLLFTGCDLFGGDDDDKEDDKKGTSVDSVLTDASITENDTVTLDKFSEYVLDGFVFVEEGAVLNIPAGTVIKGKPGEGLEASALIIARGGKINAQGTADKPIIMTALSDDVTEANDLDPTTQGLWGGLIVLGNAPVNTAAGVAQIEGIDPTDPRGEYGGSDAADNSGILKYISIRHGGSNIGEGNEINGLTFGGAG